MTPDRVVDEPTWRAERLTLLQKEKQLTRLRDEVAAARRTLPWVHVEKLYLFDTPLGQRSLPDLFNGKSQLITYHFMLGPESSEPCKSCSFWAEQYDALRVHLPHRDAELICVSRARLAKIEEVQARMGWRFPWVSSFGTDFNRDFGVTFDANEAEQALYNFGTQPARSGESPGISVFARDGDAVYHTYSAYSRGLDPLNGVYQLLDLTPKGRDEDELEWPMAWVKLKDRY